MVVECEIVPDCAVIMIEAVPRFGCAPLPYPLQPPITSTKAIIAPAAVAFSTKVRGIRTLLMLHIAMPNKTKAARREHGPSNVGTTSPYRETVVEVVTASVVLAAPLAGVTVAGLKAQVTPATGEQENVTLFEKPPAGVTVSINGVDWPAMTVAFAGDAASEKSALATLMVTAAEVLALNFSSPA